MPGGRTKTTRFSFDAPTLARLKPLATRHARGASTLRSEVDRRETQLAAAEAYFAKQGIPALTDEALERIEAEWVGEAAPTQRTRRRTR
jgi:hypothetical protein